MQIVVRNCMDIVIYLEMISIIHRYKKLSEFLMHCGLELVGLR